MKEKCFTRCWEKLAIQIKQRVEIEAIPGFLEVTAGWFEEMQIFNFFNAFKNQTSEYLA